MSQVNIALEGICMITSLIILIYCFNERKNKGIQVKLFSAMVITNMLVLLSDMFTFILEEQAEFETFLYFLNFLVYSLGYVITALFNYFLVEYISKRKSISIWIAHIIAVFCLIAVGLVVISLFNHMYFSFEDGIYIRGSMYWLSQLYPIIILIVDMFIIFKYSHFLEWQEILSLLSYEFLPLIAMIIQIKIFGVTLLYISTTLSLWIIFIVIQVEQGKKLKEKELELTKMNISIMLSQIQPHFLYNTLNSIQVLCTDKPKQAKEALGDFSKFIRGNMDSLTSDKPIHFKQELEHVKNYLNLEKMRFGKMLNIIYDIHEDDFYLPALTIQPIVENAVKYGLSEIEQGGTIIISTKCEKNNIIIIVKDNGKGFNVEELMKNNNQTHIGLFNTKNRIREMVNGELIIESEKNVGTTIKIIIPKN
ncbi:sensor histidine kinase [Thomasclavelia sp.]